MSEFKEGDILMCINDINADGIRKGYEYTFERYDDMSRVYLKEVPNFGYYDLRFIKATEEDKEVNTIQLTYAEAWEKLKEGKEVFYNEYVCRLNTINNTIMYKTNTLAEFYAPFHSTEKLFTMKKEPEYEILGLHDDLVEIEVFGLKTYQITGSFVYYLDTNGFINIIGDNCIIGRVKFKGDHTKAKIKVTVDKEGNVTYENL